MTVRLLALTLLLLSTPLLAGENVWTPIGPEGGAVKSLAIAANGRTVYAGTATGQVFRSADTGRTWTLTVPNLGGAVLHLEADPFQAGTVYAATSTKLSRSDDPSRTWSELTSRLPGPVSITFLSLDPLSPGVVYLAARDNRGPLVLRSADHGSSWQLASGDLARTGYIQSLTVHPRRRGVLFASTTNGIFRSTDSGRTWHRFAFRGAVINAIEVDPLEPSRLYAVKRIEVNQHFPDAPGIFVSEDGGGSWTQSRTEVSGSYGSRVVADPFVAGTAYFFSSSGPAYRTTDGGRQWEETLSQPHFLYDGSTVLEVNPRQPGVLLAGQENPGDRSILRSADRGATWSASGAGLRAMEFRVDFVFSSLHFETGPVNADPTSPGVLYLGLWRTSDHGRTWLGPESTPEGLLGTLAVDPAQPATVYFARSSLLYKSTDRGRTWATVGELPDYPDLLAVAAPGTLYLSSPRTLYRSTDDGAHWEALSLGDCETETYFLAAAPRRPSTLYAGGFLCSSEGVSRSTDGGETWTTVLEFGGPSRWIEDLAVAPDDPGRVLLAFANTYQGFGGGVYRTTDGGATWQMSRLSAANPPVLSLLIDPRRPSRVYAGTFAQVFVSEDSGATWILVDAGLPYARVGDLEADPFDPDTIYAATEGGLYSLAYHPGR